jgi:DNA-directed RNA polymerase specialized sigma24 family protein
MNEKKRQILSQILNELSPGKREIIHAALFDRLTREQLCENFGVSDDYLRVLLLGTTEEFSARLKRLDDSGDDAPAVRCS